MHHIPVPADVAGVIFTIGCLYLFLMGIPVIVFFLLFALLAGFGIAGWLSRWHGCTPEFFSVDARKK